MIKVKSFIRENNQLQPVEIELTLWPGIPGIQFLGLPDQHLKESCLRIKSAIRAAGFAWPLAQQVLVNLRPSHLKKTSRGLELAVAAAFLWETEQVPRPIGGKDFFVYGELSLSGDVTEPDDLGLLESEEKIIVLTGVDFLQQRQAFRRQRIDNLQSLTCPQEIPAEAKILAFERPEKFSSYLFTEAQAELLEILGAGQHSCLLAGAAGSGKSTIAQALPEVLPEPNDEFESIQKIQKKFGQDIRWYPIVKPHHTTSLMAMVGGGNLPYAGEISRAHGGVLILDELLEYNQKVQEALREPFEEGRMRVYRNGQLREYPAKAQILSTTNLCPCGKWTPENQKTNHCNWKKQKCESYRQRLSGPLLDRFEILFYFNKMGQPKISREIIINNIHQAKKFAEENQLSHSFEEIEKGFSSALKEVLRLENFSSQRRKIAVVKVSRTIANLDSSKEIKISHWRRSLDLCRDSFEKLHERSMFL